MAINKQLFPRPYKPHHVNQARAGRWARSPLLARQCWAKAAELGAAKAAKAAARPAARPAADEV